MPFDVHRPYGVSLQIRGTSPTWGRLFSVRRSSLLPPLVPPSEQPCCWLVSDNDAAPLARCAETHGKFSNLAVN